MANVSVHIPCIIKKKICKIFAENGLKITIEANKKCVDFLDVTLDLRSGIYKPFAKPNNVPLYVHNKSNHPPSVLNNIPEGINKRLSNNSSNEKLFKEAIPVYQKALKNSGYDYQMTYKPDIEPKNCKRKRERNVTWYNPPFSGSVSTNIGKKFFQIIDSCFPPDNKLHKLLNRNTIKLSYSCMQNVENIISSHNKKLLNKKQNTDAKECNCRSNKTCPLDGKCLTSGIVYQATVTHKDSENSEKQATYVGLTENTFKTRFNGHTDSFKHKEKRFATTLSQYIWKLKEKQVQYTINWKILSKAKPYSPSTKKCFLCLEEKYFIICKPEISTLNKRNELVNKCRHRNKFLLCNQ